MTEERLLNPNPDSDDQQVEKSLRPRSLAEFIGQEKTIDQLKIAIVWSQGFSRIRPPKGSTPFHNQFRIAILG